MVYRWCESFVLGVSVLRSAFFYVMLALPLVIPVPPLVIPAQAGIQELPSVKLDPRLREDDKMEYRGIV